MKLENAATRVLRIYDLWYLFQHPNFIYPKYVYIFEYINGHLYLVDDELFENWYSDNSEQDYQIIELNFGIGEESFISCVRGDFDD